MIVVLLKDVSYIFKIKCLIIICQIFVKNTLYVGVFMYFVLYNKLFGNICGYICDGCRFQSCDGLGDQGDL